MPLRRNDTNTTEACPFDTNRLQPFLEARLLGNECFEREMHCFKQHISGLQLLATLFLHLKWHGWLHVHCSLYPTPGQFPVWPTEWTSKTDFPRTKVKYMSKAILKYCMWYCQSTILVRCLSNQRARLNNSQSISKVVIFNTCLWSIYFVILLSLLKYNKWQSPQRNPISKVKKSCKFLLQPKSSKQLWV